MMPANLLPTKARIGPFRSPLQEFLRPSIGPREDQIELTAKEEAVLRNMADKYGTSPETVIQEFISGALADRIKRRTGHGPAKVYSMPKRGG